MSNQPLYCPLHGTLLKNERQVKDAGAIFDRKAGIDESVAYCHGYLDKEAKHKVFIVDEQAVEQIGEIEVVFR